jgi:hypothetical protein
MKTARTIGVVLFLLALTLVGRAAAPMAAYPLGFTFQTLEEDADQVIIEFHLEDVKLIPHKKGNTTLYSVEMENGGFINREGLPDLPLAARFVALPDRADFSVEVVESQYTNREDILVQPFGGSADLNTAPAESQPDPEVYTHDGFFPGPLVDSGEPAILRDFRVFRLTALPVQYNPVTRELRIYHHLVFRISFFGENPVNQKTHHHESPSPAFRNLYNSLIVNSPVAPAEQSAASLFDIHDYPGTYLIIYPSSAENYLAPFVNWKRRKGHRVFLACTSDIGSGYTAIKNYIVNAYNNWEYPPDFVLFIGDNSGTISVTAGDSFGDHPYSQIEGNDVLADLAVGRFSVANATQLQTVIAKTVKYESDPFMGQTDWFTSAAVIAGSHNSGLSTIQTNESVALRLINVGYTHIDSCWYTMGCTTPSTITSSMNAGISFLNYRGWIGMEGWSNSMANSLNNGWMTPIVTIPTCNTGTWTQGESFTEGFLRAGTPTMGKGGVAAVGLATSSTHTRYNNTLCMGTYGGIFDWGLTTLGQAIFRGKYELYLTFPMNAGDVADFSSWYNEMGDPGLEVRYGIPRILEAGFPESLPLGASVLPVQVTCDGVPEAGALVTCYKEDEIFERVFTGDDGSATVVLPVDYTAGTMLVTISKFNAKPVLGQCELVQEAVFPAPVGVEISDPAGDNQGDPNPGETVEVVVEFMNTGSSTTITGAQVTASVDPGFGTMVTAEQSLPDLAPGAAAVTGGPFVIELRNDLRDGTLVPVTLEITSDAGDFTTAVNLQISAPLLVMSQFYPLDGNHIIDPGESVEVSVSLSNVGSKQFVGGSAELSIDYFQISTPDSLGSYGIIQPGDTGENSADPFTVTCQINTIRGMPFAGTLTWETSTGIIGTTEILAQIGDPGTGDPTGPDNRAHPVFDYEERPAYETYGYWAFENQDSEYDMAPQYNWLEIAPQAGGDGTAVGLTDHGTEGDDSAIIDLPFPFVYYGVEYNQVTVCSNGYVAFGPQTNWFNNFRNQPFPNPQAAMNMIAPMWDDLYFSGSDDVYYYNDEDENRFIIEWYHAKNQSGHNNTFQLSLLNPYNYPTPTGDGEFVFQYSEFHDEGGGASWDNPYCSIGIENGDATEGITLSYWHVLAETMHSITPGTAIKFTTNPSGIMGAPELEISDESFSLYLAQDTTTTRTLTLGNVGESALTFSIALENLDNRDGGGPDDFGYVWLDSDEPAGPEYNWVDVTGCGQDVIFPQQDATTGELSLGFDFALYGEIFQTVRINANGFLSFSDSCSGMDCWNNLELPNPEAPRNMIAPWWDDLRPGAEPGYCYFYTNNQDTAVVAFIDVPYVSDFMGQGPFTFEVILEANGKITYQYQEMNVCHFGTVGLQDGSGEQGFQMIYNDDYIHDEMTIRISPPFWLDVDPSAGLVPAHAERDITLYFDPLSAGYLSPGEYHAMLHLGTSDPDHNNVDIPILMVVTTDAVAENDPVRSFYLKQNYPNPFNPSTVIEYGLPRADEVDVAVYDVLGQMVERLAEGWQKAGVHQLTWHSGDLAAGIYFVKVQTTTDSRVIKSILLK